MTAGAKTALRRECLARWHAVPAAERVLRDADFARRLLALPGDLVFCFIGIGDEPDTRPFLRAHMLRGGRVCLPRCGQGGAMTVHVVPSLEAMEALTPGKWGLYEPSADWPETDCPDLAVVPGLAFDRSGMRLGRGGGYYDRWLARHPKVPTVGLCDPSCLLDSLPAELHDRPVDRVIV